MDILENEPLSFVDRAQMWQSFWETAADMYEPSPDDTCKLNVVLEFFYTYCHAWSKWYTEVFDTPTDNGDIISPEEFVRHHDFELKDTTARQFETSADKGVEFFVQHGYGATLYTMIAELPCFPFVREELIEQLVKYGDIELARRIAATITDSLTERQAAFQILGEKFCPHLSF